MKMSFKYAIMAVAALTMGLTSCSNDENETPENAAKELTIKISNVVRPETKATEAMASEDAIKLEDGYIFIIDPLGNVTANSTELMVSAATTGGQVIQNVPGDSRVYIIANIPDSKKTEIPRIKTFAEIEQMTSEISTQVGSEKITLANIMTQLEMNMIYPKADNTAEIGITLAPLISRLELAQVKGGNTIKAFTVTGVYLDSYYLDFTYVGGHGETIFEQKQSVDFSSTVGDEDTWTAVTGTSGVVAKPEDNKVWAQNVASGGLPRFIIALTGVIYYDEDGKERDDMINTTFYLTVKGYDNGVISFLRGHIYRIGGLDGITFEKGNLGLFPNIENVTLTVTLSLADWTIETPEAIL